MHLVVKVEERNLGNEFGYLALRVLRWLQLLSFANLWLRFNEEIFFVLLDLVDGLSEELGNNFVLSHLICLLFDWFTKSQNVTKWSLTFRTLDWKAGLLAKTSFERWDKLVVDHLAMLNWSGKVFVLLEEFLFSCSGICWHHYFLSLRRYTLALTIQDNLIVLNSICKTTGITALCYHFLTFFKHLH